MTAGPPLFLRRREPPGRLDAMLTAPLLLALTLVPADVSTPPDGPPPPAAVRVEDAGELQGTWEVVGCFFGTIDALDDFKGDRWVFAGTSARLFKSTGFVSHPSKIRVDATRNPYEIDETNQDGFFGPGIYRRTGDELLWAEEAADRSRPRSFAHAPGVAVWTLRHVKK